MNCDQARKLILRDGRPASSGAAGPLSGGPWAHVAGCAACREALRAETALDSLLDRLTAPPVSAGFSHRVLASLPIRRPDGVWSRRVGWVITASLATAAFYGGTAVGLRLLDLTRSASSESLVDIDETEGYSELAGVLPDNWEALFGSVREGES